MISWSVGRLVGGSRAGGDKKERCELEARWIQGGERGLRVCWRQIPQNLRGNEGEAGRKKREKRCPPKTKLIMLSSENVPMTLEKNSFFGKSN